MGLLGSFLSGAGQLVQQAAGALIESGGRGLLEFGGLVGDVAQLFGAEGKTFTRLGALNDVATAPIPQPSNAVDFSRFGVTSFAPLDPLRDINRRVGSAVGGFLTPGRDFSTPGDSGARVGALGTGLVAPTSQGVVPGSGTSFVGTDRAFRQTQVSVVPIRQIHAINPVSGKLETWLHAGHPTAWSRVNVKRRRHHHHHPR